MTEAGIASLAAGAPTGFGRQISLAWDAQVRRRTAGRLGGGIGLLLALVLVAATVDVIWVLTRAGGATATLWFSDLAMVAGPLFAGAACVSAGRRVRERAGTAGGWFALGAGMFAWAAGQAVWTWYEGLLGMAVPFPSAADVGYVAMVALALAGLGFMIGSGGRALRYLLDGLILGLSLLVITWVTVLDSLYSSGDQHLLSWLLGLAYPLGDVALASMAFVLLSRRASATQLPFALLGLGTIFLAVADTSFVYLTQHDAYATGNVIDIAWFMGFLLVGVAGLLAGRPDPVPPRPQPLEPPVRQRVDTAGIVLPYLPGAVAITVAALVTFWHASVDLDSYLLCGVVVALIVVRQMLAARDNLVLARRLSETVDQLHQLAYHDTLTGLANRAWLYQHADNALARQHGPASLAALYVDLDGFKDVNDKHGHPAGDALLVAAAERLRGCVREGDTLARFGGDEFVILAEDLPPDAAATLADRIVGCLSAPFQVGEHSAALTASVGVAIRPSAQACVESLLGYADRALYAAKLQGKGRYCICVPKTDSTGELAGTSGLGNPTCPQRGEQRTASLALG